MLDLLVQQRADRARGPRESSRGRSRPRVSVRRMRAGSGCSRPRLTHAGMLAGPRPSATVPMFRPCFAVSWRSTTLSAVVPLKLATQVPAALQQFLGNDTYGAVFACVFGSPGVTPVRIVFAIAACERSVNQRPVAVRPLPRRAGDFRKHRRATDRAARLSTRGRLDGACEGGDGQGALTRRPSRFAHISLGGCS